MRAAFAEIVDYAGLFPPASLSMDESVRHYDRYRRSPDRWMLGRFVVAAQRLAELSESITSTGALISPTDPWQLSAVFGALTGEELGRITRFHEEWRERGVVVSAIECRAGTPGQVRALASQIPSDYERFFEVPAVGPYGEIIREIAANGGGAKIRTGGTTVELFPSPDELTSFLLAVVRHGVPFKATAGLHHPLGGEFPLTYAPDSAQHRMFGFVNLLLATAEVRRGGEGETAQAILEETDLSVFRRNEDTYWWRDSPYTITELGAAHEGSFTGFGCCSFREPVDELALGANA